jgi:hypothetical protein
LYEAAFVGIVHRTDGNTIFFAGSGMDKLKSAGIIAIYNTDMPDAVRVVAFCSGKKYDIACPGVFKPDFSADIYKVLGRTGYIRIEAFEYITYKT